MRIDAGENQGVEAGQNLVVRRRFQTGDLGAPKKLADVWRTEPPALSRSSRRTAIRRSAVVVYVCGELVAGDAVEPYVPQPAFFAISTGTPQFDEPARITTRRARPEPSRPPGQMMVIDHGIMQGVQRGQRLTIFRRPLADGMPLTIGDGVIIAVRADSATLRIDRTIDAVTVGDMVALHR